jgi:cytochrome c556
MALEGLLPCIAEKNRTMVLTLRIEPMWFNPVTLSNHRMRFIRMKRILIALVVCALGATAALAQSDVIAQRKALMKDTAKRFGEVGKMLKGESPFDLAKVQAALKQAETAGKQAPALFPDNSKTGGDTEALPKVWETKSDFDARFAKLAADAADAAGKITDEASFKANIQPVMKNCGGCHESYRVKKKN